jgi:hypothetical protein
MDAQEGCGVYAGSGEELLRGLMLRGLASVVAAGGGATRAPRDVPSGGAGGRNGVSGESRPRRARGLEGVWGVLGTAREQPFRPVGAIFAPF